MLAPLRTFFLGCVLVGLGACHRDPTRPQVVKLTKKRPPMRMEVEREPFVEGEAPAVLATLTAELERNFAKLRDEAPDRPAYFLAYDLVEREQLWLEAQAGALLHDHIDGERLLDVDLRVGDMQLDNSHGQGGDYAGNGLGSGVSVSLEDEELSLAQALWLVTEAQYRLAMDAVEEAEAGEALRTRSDQPDHPDFSVEAPIEHFGQPATLDLAALSASWGPLLAEASRALSARPEVLESSAIMQVTLRNHSFANSEGSRVFDGRARIRVMLSATGQAEDGMYLERFHSFDVFVPEDLPSREDLLSTAGRLVEEVLALREAPVAEPYTGPAVLEGAAAGVFFHEIFGHRLEGHRQKDDIEGQTFTGMVGKEILPPFLDVIDDPTISRLNGIPLNGHYFVDDEAVRARPTSLVEKGVLETFLLGRSPVMPFEQSNGHGRREAGHQIVARQGNLVVRARHSVPEATMREALIAEVKRQNKPYGLWFTDIQGGYTITDRSGPQAFKVLPLMVYRVYADGRPDELVRGADIVGTPLSAFETITLASDEPGVFNGVCGAESGWVPVSAVSPSLMLTKLEIERGAHDRTKPPLLAPPKGVQP